MFTSKHTLYICIYIYMATGAQKRPAKTSVFQETSSVILVFGSVPITGLFFQWCALNPNHWILFSYISFTKAKPSRKP